MFICTKCDAQYPKWQGRCGECSGWGTVVEQSTVPMTSASTKPPTARPATATPLATISTADTPRVPSGVTELDRVLGGGIVPGSLILLGGDPGIGKSTLALQVAHHVAPTLYISGEESGAQVRLRAERLGAVNENILFVSETNIEAIVATIHQHKPTLVIIDSIQTVASDQLPSSPGTVNQITACTSQLMAAAKSLGIATIIIGHVTKEGAVAGPKTLEHLVDTVLYLEHDNRNHYKILRSIKNRFGSVGEIGVFEMTEAGYREVADPSRIFVSDAQTPAPGTVISMAIEGNRPFLVETQALVTKTVFGYPQRKANGVDLGRVQMLIAVLTKVGRLDVASHDVYLNVAGGFKIKDPAIDAAVCLAIASAYLTVPLPRELIAIGEVGLSGEIRSVSQLDRRLSEAERLGFTTILAPGKNKNISPLSSIHDIVALLRNKQK